MTLEVLRPAALSSDNCGFCQEPLDHDEPLLHCIANPLHKRCWKRIVLEGNGLCPFCFNTIDESSILNWRDRLKRVTTAFIFSTSLKQAVCAAVGTWAAIEAGSACGIVPSISLLACAVGVMGGMRTTARAVAMASAFLTTGLIPKGSEAVATVIEQVTNPPWDPRLTRLVVSPALSYFSMLNVREARAGAWLISNMHIQNALIEQNSAAALVHTVSKELIRACTSHADLALQALAWQSLFEIAQVLPENTELDLRGHCLALALGFRAARVQASVFAPGKMTFNTFAVVGMGAFLSNSIFPRGVSLINNLVEGYETTLVHLSKAVGAVVLGTIANAVTQSFGGSKRALAASLICAAPLTLRVDTPLVALFAGCLAAYLAKYGKRSLKFLPATRMIFHAHPWQHEPVAGIEDRAV